MIISKKQAKLFREFKSREKFLAGLKDKCRLIYSMELRDYTMSQCIEAAINCKGFHIDLIGWLAYTLFNRCGRGNAKIENVIRCLEEKLKE